MNVECDRAVGGAELDFDERPVWSVEGFGTDCLVDRGAGVEDDASRQ